MKKIFVYLVIGLLLAVTASAYTGIVSITAFSLSCNSCPSPLALTQIIGLTSGRTVCISATSGCSCISGSASVTGNSIIKGQTYFSNTAALTGGNTYYACLKLNETSSSGTIPLLSNCVTTAAATYSFTIAGTYCASSTVAYIGTSSVREDLIFAFPFIA